jgi:phenylalanine-4-hydroxylase
LKGACTLLELKTIYTIDDLQELHFAMEHMEEMEKAQDDN